MYHLIYCNPSLSCFLSLSSYSLDYPVSLPPALSSTFLPHSLSPTPKLTGPPPSLSLLSPLGLQTLHPPLLLSLIPPSLSLSPHSPTPLILTLLTSEVC